MKAGTTIATTMRIALAGGGGFSFILAQELSKSANAVLVLSRKVGFPSLPTEHGFQD